MNRDVNICLPIKEIMNTELGDTQMQSHCLCHKEVEGQEEKKKRILTGLWDEPLNKWETCSQVIPRGSLFGEWQLDAMIKMETQLR